MAENAKDYLLDFIHTKDCSPWIKNVIYTFLDQNGSINEQVKQRLVDNLLQGKNETILLHNMEMLPISNPCVNFVSLEHITGVNALSDNQIIKFGQDLNIIYGLNGSGKSSYFRIINEIVGGAKRKEILGNVYLDESLPPKAKLTYCLDGINKECIWDNNERNSKELSTVRVFDTSYTQGLLKKRSSDELLVQPFNLSIFSEIIDLVDELVGKARERVTLDELQIPVLDTKYFGEQLIEILSKEELNKDDEVLIENLAIFEKQHEKELSHILTEIATLQEINFEDKLQLEIEHKSKVQSLVKKINVLYHQITMLINESKKAIEILHIRKRESETARRRFVNLRQIPGVESDTWKRFVSTGQEYSQENEIGVCPYCRRPYDESSLQLVLSYSEFLVDENEINYQNQLEKIQAIRKQVETLEIITKEDYDFTYITEETKNELDTFLLSVIQEKTILLQELDTFKLAPHFLGEIDNIINELNSFISTTEKTINNLNSSDAEKKEKISKLTNDLLQLQEKQSVNRQLKSIKKVINERRKIKNEKQAVSGVSTKKLSNLSKKAHNELLTKRLETEFKELLKKLNIKNVNIQLRSQNSKGIQQTELMIKGIKDIDKILSEGEQKATALALFIAEIIISNNHSVLVLDDPVNSMDHKMMGAFAEVLLQMDNQIILFTHNRLFLESFSESKNGHFCKTYDSACNKQKGKHILLYETLSEGLNSKGVICKKQIENSKTYLQAVENMLKESPFTKKQETCTKLRFAVELLIDEVIFNGQVPTKYSTKSSRINWDGLKSLCNDNAIIDVLKDVHNRCSGGELHNGLERNENPVEKEDIQEMLNKLNLLKSR